MKRSILLIISILIFLAISAQPEIDYFGQQSPGLVPEIFAKGIVSSNNQEHSLLCISQDGNEMWWSIWDLPYLPGGVQKIYTIKKVDGEWMQAELAPFSGEYKDGGPFLSYDGNRLYFYSRRPIHPDTLENDNDIWYVDRTEDGWGPPVNAGSTINTEFVEANPVLVKNNNLYFTSNRDKGNPDIYLSKYIDGNYTTPERLDSNVNTSDAREMFFTVSPDERFIIFTRDDRKFSEIGELIGGDRNLMISFKNQDGSWGDTKDMGKIFNGQKARFPSLSPDGKYLFFTRYTEGNDEDFYWIDAEVIQQYKQQ